MVSRYTTLVPSLGLHIGPPREAGLSAGIRCPTRERKKDHSNQYILIIIIIIIIIISPKVTGTDA